jgi:hypothetical protein
MARPDPKVCSQKWGKGVVSAWTSTRICSVVWEWRAALKKLRLSAVRRRVRVRIMENPLVLQHVVIWW